MRKAVTTFVVAILIVIGISVAVDVSITTDREEVLEILRAAEDAVAGADARKFESLISKDFHTPKIGKKELMAAAKPAMAEGGPIFIKIVDYKIEVDGNSAIAEVVVRINGFGIADGSRGAQKDTKWRVDLKRASDGAPWLISGLKLVDAGDVKIDPILRNLFE